MKDIFIDYLFTITILTFFIISLWMIDISVSALIVNRPLIGILNIDVDPNVSYHAGLLVATICFLLVVTFLFYIKLSNFKNTYQKKL